MRKLENVCVIQLSCECNCAAAIKQYRISTPRQKREDDVTHREWWSDYCDYNVGNMTRSTEDSNSHHHRGSLHNLC